MPMRANRLFCLMVVVLATWLASPTSAAEGLRRLHVGETMPEFSLTGIPGASFRYDPAQSRVLGLIILQAGHSHLERLVADVEALAEKLKAEGAAFDCVGVICGPGSGDFLRARQPGAHASFPIFPDPNFALWGKLGVIAVPTAVVVGSDHKIQWVKAGYSYDFFAAFHAQLAKALGLAGTGDGDVQVKALENASDRARQERHLQMARALARKGRFALAINEFQKIHEADPNAVDVALELGEILCRAGKNEAALKVAGEAKAGTDPDKARALMISAWARRQMGELDAAESLLKRALELESRSARTLYELGKVYDARGDVPGALLCYRKALAEVFGDAETRGVSQE